MDEFVIRLCDSLSGMARQVPVQIGHAITGGNNLLRSRAFRLIAVSALAASAVLGSVGLAGSAGAAGAKIKCTGLAGNINNTSTLSGCSAGTGGGSQPFPSASFATGGQITWLNGKTTTVTLSVKTTESDPDAACPAGYSEYEASGTVTADTTGFAPVGGKAKGEACVNTNSGDIKIEPGSVLKLK